jgi:YcxB-like protein
MRNDPAFIIFGVIVALLIFVWNWCTHYISYRNIVRRITQDDDPRGWVCRHDVAITPDGFEEKTDRTLSFHSWDVIKDIVITSEYIFIYVNLTSAHVLPIRELGEQLFHQAGDEIKKHWKRNA